MFTWKESREALCLSRLAPMNMYSKFFSLHCLLTRLSQPCNNLGSTKWRWLYAWSSPHRQWMMLPWEDCLWVTRHSWNWGRCVCSFWREILHLVYSCERSDVCICWWCVCSEDMGEVYPMKIIEQKAKGNQANFVTGDLHETYYQVQLI